MYYTLNESSFIFLLTCFMLIDYSLAINFFTRDTVHHRPLWAGLITVGCYGTHIDHLYLLRRGLRPLL